MKKIIVSFTISQHIEALILYIKSKMLEFYTV